MPKKYVMANFKMNKTNDEVVDYIDKLSPLTSDCDCQVVLCVPSISIPLAVQKVNEKDRDFIIACQNFNENDFGAFTGEINAEMVAGGGAGAVLIGHSERRNLFKEDDLLVNKKILKALKSGLICIFCLGESLFDKKNNLTEQVIINQLSKGLNSIYANELSHIVIAYEPVWAIGTGIVATEQEISQSICIIRNTLAKLYNEEIANNVTIVYGGSVNDVNCKDISKIKGVDGVLVGGASLIPEKFSKIAKAFCECKKTKNKK